MNVVSENNMAEAREQKINMISTLERSELPPHPSPVKERWLLGAYWEHIQQTNRIETTARVLSASHCAKHVACFNSASPHPPNP